jgi:hypothetical protein
MERFIGLDVHSASTTVAVVGPSGKLLQTQVLETNGAALVNFLRSIVVERPNPQESEQGGFIRKTNALSLVECP